MPQQFFQIYFSPLHFVCWFFNILRFTASLNLNLTTNLGFLRTLHIQRCWVIRFSAMLVLKAAPLTIQLTGLSSVNRLKSTLAKLTRLLDKWLSNKLKVRRVDTNKYRAARCLSGYSLICRARVNCWEHNHHTRC